MQKALKRYTLPGYVTYYGTTKKVMIPVEYQEKEEELRGVWFSTVANIDIPQMTDEEKIKEYLLGVIKKVKEYNMNTVVFQVRPMNDAFYQSKLNPWSRYITGVEGKNPGFDVFGFFVEEAKKEGITTHAWINPYRVSTQKLSDLNQTKEEYLKTLDKNNFARRHPECVIETSLTKLILDPSSSKVRKFVTDTVIEIAKNYDIKAVHIDDYFYPYEPIADPLEEEKFKKTKFTKISDFRRNNVDKLIKMISVNLKKLDKKVEFGISPFGIYRTNSKLFDDLDDEAAWDKGSNNHKGCFSCYKGLYADVYLWMKKKWIDYITPQDYFDFSNTKIDENNQEVCRVRYADLAKWWSWAAKKTGIKLYMGQGIYRYSDEGDWANPEEIINQLKFNTLFPNIMGTMFFTYKNFVEDKYESCVKGRELIKQLWTKPVKEI
ncbi:MAG: family 10 glycosylhydrolase [Bacilli bacterium]|nr:family 10 glycosylhydrolase [Bacilli bacterium]